MGLDVFDLEDSVAIVTGGSRGIGEAIAVAMAEAGANVVPVARSKGALDETADRIEAAGSDTLAYPLDITKQRGIEELFDEVEATLGDVDILINNAGVNPYFGNACNLDIETLESILSVNVIGTFQCTREFGQRVFKRDGNGSIVNIASVGGVVALPYQTPYTASKHAMVGMTKCLAVEWAPDIRVNALAPGYVKTNFTKGVRENESIREDILETIPQNRFADPEEIANIAVYLASDAAGYVTGEVHVADGGIAAQ
ncbi:SDR family NAD(P)-dependent oxidoreductase [Haladaptatus halobius]|uniref:SDR family NAD(P)-dependent oxidoreductase n=1 Tax=Haladaptatus halobius TaxID=2884875 RepID=UPI001D0A42A1|nr:SDR family oxidoreductase [Haladaptatus halobius]